MRTKNKIPIQASVDITLDEWIRERAEQEKRPYSYFVNEALQFFVTAGGRLEQLEARDRQLQQRVGQLEPAMRAVGKYLDQVVPDGRR